MHVNERISETLFAKHLLYFKETLRQGPSCRGWMFFCRRRGIPQLRRLPSYANTNLLPRVSGFVAKISCTFALDVVCYGRYTLAIGDDARLQGLPSARRNRTALCFEEVSDTEADHDSLERATGHLMLSRFVDILWHQVARQVFNHYKTANAATTGTTVRELFPEQVPFGFAARA